MIVDQHIAMFADVLPEGLCEHMMHEIDRLFESGVGTNRKQAEGVARHVKHDEYLFLSRSMMIAPHEGRDSLDMLEEAMQPCWDQYTERYSTIRDCPVRSREIKAQRTEQGGGYHLFHHEQGSVENTQANRSAVWMLYLNTLPAESCGETEFLYQEKRVRPIANQMLIWPAAYTHAHRGNPVYGNTRKYILTGWFCNE